MDEIEKLFGGKRKDFETFPLTEKQSEVNVRNAEIRRIAEKYPELPIADLAVMFGLAISTIGQIIVGLRKNRGGVKPGQAQMLGERKSHMIYLRQNELWTLQEIANLYRISRERVRQIVGNTGVRPYNPKKAAQDQIIRASSDKTNSQLERELGVNKSQIYKARSGMRHKIEDTLESTHSGFMGEEKFKRDAEARGYSVELMSFRHQFDAMVNGSVNCDVKIATVPLETPTHKKQQMINPIWNFSIGKKKKWKEVDVFPCLIFPLNLWFIVPAEHIRAGGIRENIRFVYPHSGRGPTSFQKYENRWDIIDKIAKEKND